MQLNTCSHSLLALQDGTYRIILTCRLTVCWRKIIGLRKMTNTLINVLTGYEKYKGVPGILILQGFYEDTPPNLPSDKFFDPSI